jgi:hypothetical protein
MNIGNLENACVSFLNRGKNFHGPSEMFQLIHVSIQKRMARGFSDDRQQNEGAYGTRRRIVSHETRPCALG